MATNQSQYEEMCGVYERYIKGGLVPVVRCKDCKYCDRGNCTFWDDGYGAIVSMDDFCSKGERR